jgi:hypothetical protein
MSSQTVNSSDGVEVDLASEQQGYSLLSGNNFPSDAARTSAVNTNLAPDPPPASRRSSRSKTDRRARFVPPPVPVSARRIISTTDGSDNNDWRRQRERPLLDEPSLDEQEDTTTDFMSVAARALDDPAPLPVMSPQSDRVQRQDQRRRGFRQQSSDRWKKLSQHVLSGEVLVSRRRPADVEDDEWDHDSQSLSVQYSLWLVHSNMFSMRECVIAIFAWIAIAVIAFKTVFGGHNWTIIDCIYFSVGTFTTGMCVCTEWLYLQ